MMGFPRVIPCLLLLNGSLIKTIRFSSPRYVGDPINIVKIFNEKEVDEIIILDITPGGVPDIDAIADIASEAFMPVSYGGGLHSADMAEKILRAGVEKVVFGSALHRNPEVIRESVRRFGSQSVVASIDVKKRLIVGNRAMIGNGRTNTGRTPIEAAQLAESLGVGELVVNSIDRDGKCTGYDIPTIADLSSTVTIPVIALGGAGCFADVVQAIRSGASAAAAGSIFIFQGPHRAVLPSYPQRKDLDKLSDE